MNGLNHNLVVWKLDNGQFELLRGERRYTALTKLVNEGNETFALVPCKVVNVNDTDAEIILIQSNTQTRELSDIEKLKQIEKLKELYNNKKKKGEKIPGKFKDIIANDLKLSPTQVGRYEKINNKLIPELKEILENGNLTIHNASEFFSLSETNQKAILDIINSKVNFSKEETPSFKNRLKKLEVEKELEIANNKTLIRENKELKKKANFDENKNKDTEFKELEGQLKIKLEKLKTSAPKEISKEFEENIKLIQDLKAVKSSLISISKQYRKMKNSDVNISDETLNILKDTLDVSYILTSMNISK